MTLHGGGSGVASLRQWVTGVDDHRSDVGSRRWIRSAVVAAENSSVCGAASTVVESSLSRTILGISEGCGGRAIVGAAEVVGGGALDSRRADR